MNAYQDSQTQSNDVETLRDKTAYTDAHPQTCLEAAEQSNKPERIKPYQAKQKKSPSIIDNFS